MKQISEKLLNIYKCLYFTWVSKDDLNIPIDIYVYYYDELDDINFTNIVIIQNSYNHFEKDYLMFDIKNKVFLNKNSNKTLNISRKDLYYILNYIINNKEYFSKLSTGIIRWDEFMKGCRNNRFHINESKRLYEMSNLATYETGLPVKIWVDTDQTYKLGKHTKRIKFNVNNKWATMRLHDCETIGAENCKSEIINTLKLFVDENKENLSKLADAEISFDYFKEHMVIFNNKGKFIYPELEPYAKYDNILNRDLEIVIDKDTKLFNILDTDEGILYDIWFDKIVNTVYKDKKTNKEYLKGFKNNDVYYLYLDGTFKKLNF